LVPPDAIVETVATAIRARGPHGLRKVAAILGIEGESCAKAALRQDMRPTTVAVIASRIDRLQS
jgi:hypothetical protein